MRLLSLAPTRPTPVQPFWLKLRRALCALCLCGLYTHASAGVAQPSPAPFVMGADESAGDETVYTRRWTRRIYDEAFKRMGLAITYASYPTARLTLMMERGEIDGETGRAQTYASAHPGLIRVDEPLFTFVFALFAADDSLRLNRLEDLGSGNARVETRLGVEFCDNALRNVVPEAQLSRITSTRQGLEKLMLKRTDYFCDLDVAVLNLLYTPSFSHTTAIRKVLDLGRPTSIYPYLSSKNGELAPKLAVTLKKMRTEGLIDRYRQDTLRELGR